MQIKFQLERALGAYAVAVTTVVARAPISPIKSLSTLFALASIIAVLIYSPLLRLSFDSVP